MVAVVESHQDELGWARHWRAQADRLGTAGKPALACAVGAKARNQLERVPRGVHRSIAGVEKSQHLGRHGLDGKLPRAALAALLQQRAIGRVKIDHDAVGDGAETIAFGFILECDEAHR